ncbi:MAG: hypothetical protein DWQ34_14810 [Planctomycetota bacterium]|nr:MAG: hypothetical protein DWQ29_17285 [Planctomycetota bacterium]REJ91549.1 MAG: hypothetical protein DWQ34_14810 [Planctomycetota bacterium]REK20518.1 MAG: hypothetical protein DWQ41_24825 [Planctomycetota bacterium]REK28272.1 MAG: hypothetical protein DWQ45_24735 [Planctomycetota bacterium]
MNSVLDRRHQTQCTHDGSRVRIAASPRRRPAKVPTVLIGLSLILFGAGCQSSRHAVRLDAGAPSEGATLARGNSSERTDQNETAEQRAGENAAIQVVDQPAEKPKARSLIPNWLRPGTNEAIPLQPTVPQETLPGSEGAFDGPQEEFE